MIHDILDAATSEFEISREDVAVTAIRAMFMKPGLWRDGWLINEYSGLRPETQRSCETALSKLAKKGQSLKAHMVFDALAAGVENKPAGKHDRDPATLISNYVSALARLWKAAGLRPGRAYREGDRPYKSKFHSYSDLILTAVAEPWAQRHSGDLAHTRQRIYKAWAGMPREYKASAALPPSKAEWLISEYILRKGLGQRVQKQRHQRP